MLSRVTGRASLAWGQRSFSSCYNRYPFLKELGLEEDNAGVYDGEFRNGSGPVITSYNPATNEPIATVKGASVQDYDQVVSRMNQVHEQWMTTPAPRR